MTVKDIRTTLENIPGIMDMYLPKEIWEKIEPSVREAVCYATSDIHRVEAMRRYLDNNGLKKTDNKAVTTESAKENSNE